MDRQILDYLPQEVPTDIFTTVPIKSLLLCTLVCKSWHTFVTDPSFVIAHLNRPRTLSHNNAHDLILLRNYSEQRKEEVYSLRFDDESFREYQKIEFLFKSAANDFYRVVGCCNGVVCITDDQFRYAHDTVLWNPSIRKSVTLPKPRISEAKFEHVMGFGKRPEIDVYRFSSGSWEDISRSGGLGFYSIRKKALQAYLNGAVHCVRPAVFLGDLALIECKISTGQENWSVWVMREYCVAESWTEHLCLEVGQIRLMLRFILLQSFQSITEARAS
ncbi:F-box protein At3g07870-like [Rhododendron vialii]|uniref:F-box protein At3g07870-like n=1 Tax=Rhododendron vialii TaxID=182163 RepID=UPI00266013E4|nr:F-box protein At3g07870-like [Rhododendron vialii]